MTSKIYIQPGAQVKLSKTNIDAIKLAGIYRDTELTGFRLWVGESGTKTYQQIGKVAGQPRPVYVTIGKHGDPWTPDTARKEAERLRLLMRQGKNPNQLKKDSASVEATRRAEATAQQASKALTLSAAFEEHLAAKKQNDSTTYNYNCYMRKHFADWLDKPLITITSDEILERYKKIYKLAPKGAGNCMRLLHGIFSTAIVEHGETIPELPRINPVKRLNTRQPGWSTPGVRDTFIQDEDLPAFYKATMKLDSDACRDFLLVAVLTGLRKMEVLSLTWSTGVDLQKRIITIVKTKNNKEHKLYMPDYLHKLFLRRWQNRKSDYVFPGLRNNEYYNSPELPIQEVIKEARIEHFSPHDLRRTFATCADSLGYDLRAIQRLLNHTGTSVTDRNYIQKLVRKTKEPMERINGRLLKLMKVPGSNIKSVRR